VAFFVFLWLHSSDMKQLLCSLLVFAFCCVHAQSHFQPGKVLPNTGDTLRGEIDYGNWAVNPRTIRFRSGPGGAHVYSVADLRYFEVDGMDSYFRAPVTKDMRPIAESGMAMAGSSDTTAQDTVWLRVLVQGKRLSLFELIDSKPHFYIQDTPGVYTELRYQRFLRTDMVDVIQEDNGFQNQLMVYLPDSGSKGLQMRIEHASYSEGSLTRMVSALNGQLEIHDLSREYRTRDRHAFFASHIPVRIHRIGYGSPEEQGRPRTSRGIGLLGCHL
jgi:hypothetical protein